MDQETLDYFSRPNKKNTFFGNLRFKIDLYLLPKEKLKHMRETLKSEAKILFIANVPDDNLGRILKEYYDDLIDILPKGTIVVLFNEFMDYKNTIDPKLKELKLANLIGHLNVYYGLKGWMLNIILG